MSGLSDSLSNASTSSLVFTTLGALVALYFGFSGLVRARRIEDVPTARVRSAPQGYVELIGTARALDGEPIIAPLSKTTCCWFSYRVERRSGRDWRSVESGVSDSIFLLQDDTGQCVIDPEGAEVTTRNKSRWSDDGNGWGTPGVHARMPSLGRKTDVVVNGIGKVFDLLGSGVGDYRYSESIILDGDPLYAIGRFHTVGDRARAGTLNDQTGAILRAWKQRPDTLRERFDTNRDGHIDAVEWERAREIAKREALAERADQPRSEQLHTLKRPKDRRPFLIANLAEFGLLHRYRWRSRIGFGVFALLGGALVLMLAGRI